MEIVADLHLDPYYGDKEEATLLLLRSQKGTTLLRLRYTLRTCLQQSQSEDRKCVGSVRDEDADNYHLYITNLPKEQTLPHDIATIYRCRWEIELLLQELKTRYELYKFDTPKKHIVEIVVYTALLTLLVSRDLLSLVW
ncbi:hypothetical protein GCM10009000_109370 [Halobacterium noricense]